MKMECPSCEQHLDVPDKLVGQTIDCPSCGENIAVKEAEPVAPQAGQTKLKITQSKKNPGLSKQQIAQHQSRQSAPSEEVLRGLSEEVRLGSLGAMHSVSHLTGSNTPLRETAASTFSGPVTKVLFGVGIALFILFNLIGGVGGCMLGSTAKMQNRLADIESDMIDDMEAAESMKEAGQIVAQSVAELKKINISNLDDEYQTAIKNYIAALQKWSVALKQGDTVKADQFNDERWNATSRLNDIMKRKGEYN